MICPICKQNLIEEEKRVYCNNKHSFDKAKSGYINLLLNHLNSGDNLQMIEARSRVMNDGYFSKLADELVRFIQKLNLSNIVDVGCGEGYYSDLIGRSINKKLIGVDISKHACNKAAKTNKTNTYIVSSISDLPFSDKSFDGIINIFAPLNEDEFNRICNGYLIKVIPNLYHLKELKELLYDNVYYKVDYLKLEKFELVEEHTLTYSTTVTNLLDLFTMTPYFYKTKISNYEIFNQHLNITMDFKILIFKSK